MKLYYRISDKSYEKQKLIGATKKVCLNNFLEVFEEVDTCDIMILCDNCEPETIEMVKATGLIFGIGEEGNAGSLRTALGGALAMCEDDELVYFCEDDYLHLPNAPTLLEEGIKRADYVTLYDHPDKYSRFYNGGEHSKVIRTPSSHWRYTASTCMTFGVKAKTLREDMETWKKFTSEDHPHDYHIFTELGEKKRRLAVCIPGAACHTDLTFSGTVNYMTIDPWAVQMMIDMIEEELANKVRASALRAGEYVEIRTSLVGNKTGPERLMALDAMRQVFK